MCIYIYMTYVWYVNTKVRYEVDAVEKRWNTCSSGKKGRRWCRHSMFWQANQTGMSQQPKSCVLGLGKAKQTKWQSGFSGNSHVLDLSKSSGAREDQGDTLYWRCLERSSLGVNNDMRRAKQTKHKQTSTNAASPNRTPRLHHPATWNIPSSRDPRYPPVN